MRLQRVANSLLNAIYPVRCGLCGELGDLPLCEACSSDFEPNARVVEHTDGLDFRYGVFRYRGRAAQAVTRLKYARSTTLGRPMAALLESAGSSLGLFDGVVAVPVPIHWSRRAQRGFNQSELLCTAMPPGLVDGALLKRVRATKPQAGLSVEERQKNLDGAFWASPSVSGQAVLLVDDVVTSGQTAKACASVLYAAGAIEVGILAFAGNPEQEEAI